MEDIKLQSELIGNFKDLQAKLGKDPAKVLKEEQEYIQEIKFLREELLERPQKEVIKSFHEIKNQNREYEETITNLKEEIKDLNKKNNSYIDLENENETLKKNLNTKEGIIQILEEYNTKLNNDIKRLNPTFEKSETRELRIKEIEKVEGISELNINTEILKSESLPDEISWLKKLMNHVLNMVLDFLKDFYMLFTQLSKQRNGHH